MRPIGSAMLCSILALSCASTGQQSSGGAPPSPKTESYPRHLGRFFVNAIATRDPGERTLASALEAVVATELGKYFPDGVISYTELENRVRVLAMGDTLGDDDKTQLGQLAELVAAQYVLLGSLSRLGDTYWMSVAVFDVAQNRVSNRISERGASADDLTAAIIDGVRAMYHLPSRVPPEQLKELIQTRKGMLRHCYNTQLRDNPELAGKVLTRLVIEPDGTVSNVRVDRDASTITDPAFVSCIEVAMMSLNLGYQIDGRLDVTYPWIFRLE